MLPTDEQALLRDTLRTFAREQLAPGAAQRDREKAFPAAQLKALAAMGVFGVTVPVEWGGAGMDTVSLAIAIMVDQVAHVAGAAKLLHQAASSGAMLSSTRPITRARPPRRPPWLARAARERRTRTQPAPPPGFKHAEPPERVEHRAMRAV